MCFCKAKWLKGHMIRGQEPIKVSHYSTKFNGQIVLVDHVISQDQVIKALCKFTDRTA